jgi:outer membrane protein assembly factor BamB
MQMQSKTISLLSACAWAVLCAAASGQGGPVDLLTKTNISGGLIVHVGATDGQLEAEVADRGRYLVHGLAVDNGLRERAREAMAIKGVYGLASVATWHDRNRLPYASNLATVVMADLDALGSAAPGQLELARVVAPEGALIVKTEGKWRVTRKPRPATMDDWKHFDHGADGNPVSQDVLVAPIRQQQWITGVQPNPFEGNPAGYSPGAGVRIWRRYAVVDVNDAYAATRANDRDTWVLQGRDAFNGIPLWTVPRDREVSGRRWSLVAADGEVFAWLERDGQLTALDITTGKPVRKYPGTGYAENGLREETACVRVAGDRLVVGLRERIACFDRRSGRPCWSAAREGKLLLGAVVDEGGGRVYCLVAKPGGRREFGGRWPTNQNTEALLAIDLSDGRTLWECKDVASRDVDRKDGKPGRLYRRGPGQIVPAGSHVILFGSCAISGGNSPYIATIDAKTGSVLHQTDEPFRQNYNVWGYNVLWRDGAAWFAGAFTNVWRYQPPSGHVERVIINSWNQRCTRFTATPRYFLFGQSAYYDKSLGGEQVCAARSGCAMGNIPANGMTYFTPNACGCITQVRGFQAMTSNPPPKPLAAGRRFVRGAGKPATVPAAAPDEMPPGPVAEDWLKQWRAGRTRTEPVKTGDLELVAVVHQHRLEGRRDGKVLWSVVADGRISTPPVVVAGVAVFGSHDGWVYAVKVNDGLLQWKFLLAPAERYVCVNGQLESSWPVYGVCPDPGDSGSVVASAGTHVELAGGVTVAAFEAATGEVRWKKHLAKRPGKVPPGGRNARIVGHSFINSLPRIVDGQIVLGDGGRKGGYFAFRPEDRVQELNERLASPPEKKR